MNIPGDRLLKASDEANSIVDGLLKAQYQKEKPELTTIEGPGPLNPIGAPKIDWTKPVETQRGQKVHIYAIDHNLKQPVIGKIIDNNELYTWAYDGKFSLHIGRETPLDLRNVKEEK